MANGNSHDWAFAAASRGEIVQTVAICSRCGLIRTEADQSATGGERRLDLAGDCPEWEAGQLQDRLGQM